MINIIRSLALNRWIRQLDYQFSRFMWQQTSTEQDLVALLSMLVSYELGKGNVCIDLNGLSVHKDFLQVENDESLKAVAKELKQLDAYLQDNPVSTWESRLQALDCIGEKQPLVIKNHYLYLNRYWHYEHQLAESIKIKSAHQCFSSFRNKLEMLFPPGTDLDWQKIAAAIAVSRQFSVISGGPGTGKTTTVSRILAMLILLYQQQDILPVIKLTAPTGKAAARLNESLAEAVKEIKMDEVKAGFPTQATTIHRLLKMRGVQTGFVHHKHNPLVVDVLIVDEASMVDLPLMSKLVSALPDHAQLILLGDKDQLSSVEAGSVLGDICSFMDQGYSNKQLEFIATETGYQLKKNKQTEHINCFADSLCQLKKSYRFDKESGIGQLAKAVNRGEVDKVTHILAEGHNDIDYVSQDRAAQGYAVQGCSEIQRSEKLILLAAAAYRAYLQLIVEKAEPTAVIQEFNRFRVLCAARQGKSGVSEINNRIEQQLILDGFVDKSPDDHWYIGRPVMLSRNNYELELYNGDIGITMSDTAGRLKVYFDMPDNSIKAISPGRLNECETVYAMTVHKSQGSEFNHVALLFPEKDSPLLTRELLYTGITRARKKLSVFSPPALLSQAAQRKTIRISGLQAALRSPG